MKKYLLIVAAVIGFGISVSVNAQGLSPEQQEIISRQRTEIQQKRNSANEWQAKADDARNRCEVLRKTNSKEPSDNGKAGYSNYVERECDKAREYQKQADKLRAEANELERLLNAAIEQAKRNAR